MFIVQHTSMQTHNVFQRKFCDTRAAYPRNLICAAILNGSSFFFGFRCTYLSAWMCITIRTSARTDPYMHTKTVDLPARTRCAHTYAGPERGHDNGRNSGFTESTSNQEPWVAHTSCVRSLWRGPVSRAGMGIQTCVIISINRDVVSEKFCGKDSRHTQALRQIAGLIGLDSEECLLASSWKARRGSLEVATRKWETRIRSAPFHVVQLLNFIPSKHMHTTPSCLTSLKIFLASSSWGDMDRPQDWTQIIMIHYYEYIWLVHSLRVMRHDGDSPYYVLEFTQPQTTFYLNWYSKLAILHLWQGMLFCVHMQKVPWLMQGRLILQKKHFERPRCK